MAILNNIWNYCFRCHGVVSKIRIRDRTLVPKGCRGRLLYCIFETYTGLQYGVYPPRLENIMVYICFLEKTWRDLPKKGKENKGTAREILFCLYHRIKDAFFVWTTSRSVIYNGIFKLDIFSSDSNIEVKATNGSMPIWIIKKEKSSLQWSRYIIFKHVFGCVLCAPGCFSLFRASALMDDNVMHKYTKTACEPRHFVQYDQVCCEIL